MDASSVVVVYAGHRNRAGRLYSGSGPPTDEIRLSCHDDSPVYGKYVEGHIVIAEPQ